MSNGPHGESVTFMLYCGAVLLAVLGVTLMAVEWRDQRTASNEIRPGTTVVAVTGHHAHR
jgi:hypothetical protein